MFKKIFISLSCCLVFSQAAFSADSKYRCLSPAEYRQIQKTRYLQISLLQRVRNLEILYKEIEKINDGFSYAIKIIKGVLGLGDLNPEKDSDSSYEHISGLRMDPGFVSFTVSTRSGETFDELGIQFLEFDLYHNANLFEVEKIDGDKVFGDEFSTISLSQRTRAAKTRIKLPISDLLTKELDFTVYLAPRDLDAVKVGDATTLEMRYFKRVPRGEEAPLIFDYSPGSAKRIKVVLK